MSASDLIPIDSDGLPDVDALVSQGMSRAEALQIWAMAFRAPSEPLCEFVYIHPMPKTAQ